jgi:hypothetical protein
MDLLLNLKNNIDISALVIATIGALFSIASALYLTSRKISAELKYRRIDLTRIYAETLLKKRLDVYPVHWSHLSRYLKIIRDTSIRDKKLVIADVQSLYDVYEKIIVWNSDNALIFSDNTARASQRMREAICRILIEINAKKRSGPLTEEEKNEIIKSMARLEVAMRTDIGILEVDIFESRSIFISYGELRAHIDSRKLGMMRFFRRVKSKTW